MIFLRLLLAISFITLSACNKTEKPITLAEDKVHEAMEKDLAELEADKQSVEQKNKDLDSKIEQLSSNPKFMDLLRKQKFTNNKNLEMIEQARNYMKIKSLDREKYINDNLTKLNHADLDSQFADYSINKKANPPFYPWRIKPVASGPQKKDEKKPEEKKPPAEGGEHGGGHGGGHEAPKAEEKPAGHH